MDAFENSPSPPIFEVSQNDTIQAEKEEIPRDKTFTSLASHSSSSKRRRARVSIGTF